MQLWKGLDYSRTQLPSGTIDQARMSYSSTLRRTTSPTNWRLEMNLPSTPQMFRDRAYHNHNNAGKLAVKFACEVLFTERVMAASSITGDQGRLEVLDADKLNEIEDIVVRM